ncbi:uncharacterized protein LOC115218375 [Argonauta hians]
MWLLLRLLLLLLTVSPLSLPMAFSFDSLILTPDNPFVLTGDCIVFNCTLNSAALTNTSALYFTLNSTKFPSSQMIFHQKYATFTKCLTDVSQQGCYICKYFGTEEHAGQVVKVDKKLVPIPADSVKCIVMNWRKMFCSWSLGQHYHYMENIYVDLRAYVIPGSEVRKTNLLTNVTLHQREIMLDVPLYFNLTVHYRLNTKEHQQSTVLRLNASKPVQPDPVQRVQLRVTDVLFHVTWRHSYFYKLYFKLVLESEGTKILNTFVNESKFSLDGLSPFNDYTVKIYAMPQEKSGILSKPYVYSFTSEKSIPSHSPDITDGYFLRDYSDANTIMVFWKGLKRQEFGDEYIEYVVQRKNVNVTTTENHVKLKLTLKKGECEDLKIWARNSIGQAKSASYIHICDKSKVPDYPERVEAIVMNSTAVLVQWQSSPRNRYSKTLRYTVFRCHKVDYPNNCMWSYINGSETSTMLVVDSALSGYIFAVSVENGEGSSGLLQVPCLFTLKEPHKPVAFQVKADVQAFSVEWEHYNCNFEEAYITNYIIFYCLSKNSTDCRGKIMEKNVSKVETKSRIEDLDKDDYLVWVKSSSRAGDSPVVSKKQIRVYGSKLTMIICILMGVVFAILLSVLFYQISRWKKYADEIPIDIGNNENYYYSISGGGDTVSTCMNEGNSSVSMTTSLCLKTSDAAPVSLFDSRVPEQDLPKINWNVVNASKIWLAHCSDYNDCKGAECINNDCDDNSPGINDTKHDGYIKAVSTEPDCAVNSTGYISDNEWQLCSPENKDSDNESYLKAVPSSPFQSDFALNSTGYVTDNACCDKDWQQLCSSDIKGSIKAVPSSPSQPDFALNSTGYVTDNNCCDNGVELSYTKTKDFDNESYLKAFPSVSSIIQPDLDINSAGYVIDNACCDNGLQLSYPKYNDSYDSLYNGARPDELDTVELSNPYLFERRTLNRC